MHAIALFEKKKDDHCDCLDLQTMTLPRYVQYV